MARQAGQESSHLEDFLALMGEGPLSEVGPVAEVTELAAWVNRANSTLGGER